MTYTEAQRAVYRALHPKELKPCSLRAKTTSLKRANHSKEWDAKPLA
jgi:hypothetical protein